MAQKDSWSNTTAQFSSFRQTLLYLFRFDSNGAAGSIQRGPPIAPRFQVTGSGTEWSGEEETGVNPLRRILTGEDVEVSLDLRD